jgi:hypothetical protein
MPYHVRLVSTLGTGQILDVFNVSEDILRERVLEQYELGTTITWSGRSIPVDTISSIYVFRTDSEVPPGNQQWPQIRRGEDLTNELITSPPGSRASAPTTETACCAGASRARPGADAMILALTTAEWQESRGPT